ncbi:MAG: hypothetical protein Q8K30_05910 [Candidatus Gracilibacteria bacterium]|nr:hypothetical protein [Candidatus Gracilibacteria bacterium]
MKKEKRAVVFIYVLFLVTISVIFATIILNNNSFLFNISDYFEVESKVLTNISNDSEISIKLHKDKNSNGSGFIDNIGCPTGTGVTMSGTINTDQIGTTLVSSGSIYCLGDYFGDELKIYFNTGFTDFSTAEYNGYLVTLSGGLGLSNFSDTDSTLIDFSGFNYNIGDGYDDNFNSDNYRVTSTGNTSTGVYYPNNWQDDDVVARKMFYGFISPSFGYKKVFWNTSKTNKIIDDNTNNNDSLNIKIGDTTSAYLYIDIDKSFDIKLVKFDRNSYNNFNELIIKEKLDGTSIANIGYLQNNGGVLSLSGNITGNEYDFDFTNNDYALFVKSTGTGTLIYNIRGESSTGTGIYINPIDDSNSNFFRYMGNEIIIDNNGKYISKETELFFTK